MEEQPNLGGRPRIEIDMDQLAELVSIQCTAKECARVLGVSEDTLDRRLKEAGFAGFADYFEQKAEDGRASLRREQWKLARSGNATMLVWLGKQWLGQKDKTEMTGQMAITIPEKTRDL